MENLIDFIETQTNSQNTMSWTSNKIFGVIRHECFAFNVTAIEAGSSEKLNRGTLIKIIPDYRGDQCLFKVQDFTNSDKYKTTIYKCSKNDYIVVNIELWPYLVASKNFDGRIKFIENVYSRKFNLGTLQLGREIRIRGPPSANIKYYEFTVTHNGAVKEIGTGYYIGLQFKSKQVPLTTEMKLLSQNYRFGGQGIVASADWIMFNLYKESSNCNKTDNVPSFPTHIVVPSKINEKEIRNNRVKKPGITNRVCPNEDCKNVLDSTQTLHTNNERCPKCKRNWCYICLSLHEPGERHGNNLDKKRNENGLECFSETASPENVRRVSSPIMEPNKINNMGAIPKTRYSMSKSKLKNNTIKTTEPMKHIEKTNCNLCAKRIEIGCAIILRECKHSFCRECLRDYVQQKSKYSIIQCPFNKNFDCQSLFMDSEIKDVGGDLMYSKVMENRLNDLGGIDQNAVVRQNMDSGNTRIEKVQKTVSGSLSDICAKCFKSIATNECTMLKNCEHSFCNGCIVIMIKTQTSGSSYAQCTICGKILEDDEVTKLAGSGVLKLFLENRYNRPEVVQPVELCCCSPRTPNCVITLKCNHQFCGTFLTKLLKNQFNCISRVVCPTCLVEIDNNLLQHLVNLSEEKVAENCRICSKRADVNLVICRHSFCHECIHDIIMNQALDFNKMSIDCTICKEPITDLEISRYGSAEMLALFKTRMATATLVSQSFDQLTFNENPFNSTNSTSLVECLRCEEKFMECLIITCTKCANSICLKCAKTLLLGQIANNTPHKCSFCETLLTESQIDNINTTITAQPARMTIDDERNHANYVEAAFECFICEKTAERDNQIELTNCKHKICRKCLLETISAQMLWSRSPKCPICMKDINQNQLYSLEISTTSNHLADLSHTRDLTSECLEETDTCSVCHGQFQQKVILKECGHEFCQQCVQANFAVQQSNGSTPKCPMCRKSIDTDQITVIAKIPTVTRTNIEVNDYPITPLKLNNLPFECIICDQVIDSECGIVLANCGDSLCRDCIGNVMLQQSANTIAPNCPVCQTQIADEEVRTLAPAVYDIIMENRLDGSTLARGVDLAFGLPINNEQATKPRRNKSNSNISERAETCSICHGKFRQTYCMADCRHKFCRQCIKTSVEVEQSNGIEPRCPLCRKPIESAELIMLNCLSINSNTVAIEVNRTPNRALELNNHPFECVICYQNIHIECGLTLKNCGDLLCRDCVSNVILQQSTSSLIPKCPLCHVQIADEEVRALDPVVYDIFVENRITMSQ